MVKCVTTVLDPSPVGAGWCCFLKAARRIRVCDESRMNPATPRPTLCKLTEVRWECAIRRSLRRTSRISVADASRLSLILRNAVHSVAINRTTRPSAQRRQARRRQQTLSGQQHIIATSAEDVEVSRTGLKRHPDPKVPPLLRGQGQLLES